jgi:hypothetical protein
LILCGSSGLAIATRCTFYLKGPQPGRAENGAAHRPLPRISNIHVSRIPSSLNSII